MVKAAFVTCVPDADPDKHHCVIRTSLPLDDVPHVKVYKDLLDPCILLAGVS